MNGPRRAFTHAEFSRIHRELDRSPAWERALFHTFAATGLRMKEVCNLNVGAVLWQDCVADKVPVPPRLQKGRFGTTRWLPMTPEWRRALREHFREWRQRESGEFPLPSEPLCVRPLARDPSRWVRVTRDFARARLNALLDRARVFHERNRVSSHTWRKTYAHHILAAAHGNLFVVQKALNHASAFVTEKYAITTPRRVQRAIRLADWTRRPRQGFP